MRRPRFYFIEPSKVGRQHITVIEGYLKAIASSEGLCQSFDTLFCASRTSFESLSPAMQQGIRHEAIPVMNPEKRRLVLKTLVEFCVVLRYLLRMRRGDVVFVSCMLPTSLLMLECVNALLRRRGLYVTLHGEVEGLFDKPLQNFRSYGFWIAKWMSLRRPNSTLSLVVIDDFIKRKLLCEYPDKLSDKDVFVVYCPISAFTIGAQAQSGMRSACFIGYRTKFKGFDQFRALSETIPDVSFLAIGGGKVEEIRSARSSDMSGNDGYLQAISFCWVAVFPYVGGYTCSLSGAVMDALSTGLHIVASDRPCFAALAENLGPDVVTICRFPDEARTLLSDAEWLDARRNGQTLRLARLALPITRK